MSARVMDTLAGFAPEIEVYSIGEAFLDFSGITDPDGHSRKMREIVARWTGILVSVGIGQTKTLEARSAMYSKPIREQLQNRVAPDPAEVPVE
jgi:nucleotidyltransferase/DNA polymerase involved in DNA repair